MLETLLFGIPGLTDGLPMDTPVYCSELVKFHSEFRVYVINGEIKAICQYTGPLEG